MTGRHGEKKAGAAFSGALKAPISRCDRRRRAAAADSLVDSLASLDDFVCDETSTKEGIRVVFFFLVWDLRFVSCLKEFDFSSKSSETA